MLLDVLGDLAPPPAVYGLLFPCVTDGLEISSLAAGPEIKF